MDKENRGLFSLSLASLALVFSLLSAALCSACGPSAVGAGQDKLRETELRLVLPRIPESWQFLGDFRYLVSWTDPAGLEREAFCAPGEVPVIRLAAGQAACVLAWPLCGGKRMRPAGALYPLDLGGEAWPPDGSGAPLLELGWEGGWLSEVFSRLAAAGRDPGLFNFARLEAELSARGGDPWELDPGLAAARLMQGRLRRDFFRQAKRYAVELPAPPCGEGGAEGWALESALAPAPLPPGAGGGSGQASFAWTASLPAGASLVVGKDFDLAAEVESGGSALLVLLPRD